MTLQNKKTGLLGHDDDDGSDVPDLFDRYGAGDDNIVEPTSTTVPQNVTRPTNDQKVVNDTEVVQNMSKQANIVKPQQKTEKKWEQEYDNKSKTKKERPAPMSKPPEDKVKLSNVQSSAPVVRSKKDAPKPQQISKKQSKSVHAVAPVKQNINAVVQSEITQPIKKKSIQPKVDKPTREVHIDPSKKTIMIVDDDIDTMEMYADVFEDADYNIIRAADGLEALSLLSEHTPHVIFTGIVMPRMDGFTMMESLKQNKRTADIPVVINSHLGRDTDKKKAEELGARDFIIRGFTQPREVLERIGALLLRSEYIFHFNKTDRETRKLAKDLGTPNFFRCPRGQEMVLKLSITDEKNLTFSARFSCIDAKEDKK